MAKDLGGRPTVITDDVLHKLEEVFALGGTDKEACFYADIAPATLYKYQEKHPEFVERKAALKEKPVLLARQTVVKSLQTDVNSAWKMLERKDPEMNPKTSVDITSKGESLSTSPEIAEITKKLNELYRGTNNTGNGGASGAVGEEA